MTKPRMAKGSKVFNEGVVCADGIELEAYGGTFRVDHGNTFIVCSSDDAIRALVEGGKLELWDAAVEIVETMRESRFLLPQERVAIEKLCRVIDDMKEPTP